MNRLVIDADSHLAEPPDLWTSRLPKKWLDDAPRVEYHEESQTERWRVGDAWVMPVGRFARAGWNDFPPSYPRVWSDVSRENYDPAARTAWMDEHGITAQVLYPNLVAFEGHALIALKDPELRDACVRAQNDYLLEFSQAAPNRFILIANLPFWNREAAISEMRRCANLGFTGVVWAATLDRHGLPATTDPYWDPFWAEAQDLEMSISFHVGVGLTEGISHERKEVADYDVAEMVYGTTIGFMGNARTISRLILHQVCHRFPKLAFVSVESGFGFVPFLLETLDWQWKNVGGHRKPDLLLPSEYFERQIYTMFWFEEGTLSQLPLYSNNTMFETDMPHVTSLTPGAGSAAESPRAYVERAVESVGDEIMSKVLFENAARLYRYTPSPDLVDA